MAEGGEAHYCATVRAHQKDCEYFAEGGDTLPKGFELDTPTNDELPPGFELDTPGSDSLSPIPQGLDDMPSGDGKYSSAGQKAATLVEGLGQGVAGPLAPMAETAYGEADHEGKRMMRSGLRHGLPGGVGLLASAALGAIEDQGLTPEDIKGRAEENPGLHVAGQAAGTLSSLGLSGAATDISNKLVQGASRGANMLKQAISGGILTASDEVSKWALGQGDPIDGVGSALTVGAGFLLSGFFGAVGGNASKTAKKALDTVAEEKMAQKAQSFLFGFANAPLNSEGVGRDALLRMAERDPELQAEAFRKGMKAFDGLIPKGGAVIGGVQGYHEHGISGIPMGMLEGLAIGTGGRFAVKGLGKYLAPATIKILSSGTTKGMVEALDYAAKMAQGSKMIDTAIGSMSKLGPVMGQQAASSYGGDKLKQDIDTWLGKGGMSQNIQSEIYDMNNPGDAGGMAEGGEVKPKPTKGRVPGVIRHDDGVALHYPEHNVMINTARGRVSNYLLGLRPQTNTPKLPFDAEPDQREKKKKYDRALHVAVSPLSVLDDVKKGTITPEHVQHLNMMYPELFGLLQKRLTSQVVRDQVDGRKPSYKVRQGLSLLMGAALSSEMTPQAIQAAQSVFQAGTVQPATNQPPAPGKTSASKLTKSDQAFLTGSQAREKRAQRPS